MVGLAPLAEERKAEVLTVAAPAAAPGGPAAPAWEGDAPAPAEGAVL